MCTGNEILSGSKRVADTTDGKSNGATGRVKVNDPTRDFVVSLAYVGLVVKTASPELLSVFPPAAERNLEYPEVGM